MIPVRILSAIAALAMLGGCVGADIEAMRNAEGGGSAFTRALTEEYRQITLFEADEMYDWHDAGYFARKGLRTAGGEVVEPERIEDWKLPPDKVNELASARARLVALLDSRNYENLTAREKAPADSAIAQGRFDCWIEQQEENHQPDHIAACRDEFYAALARVEEAMKPPPPAPAMAEPQPYVVFFAFDSALLSNEGEAIIDDAVSAARAMGTVEFSVTGHTDRAGSEDYNLRLSLTRANSVKDALVARGVDASSISVAGRGESEPAVATPDGVAEQANRRVVIIIQ